MLADRLLELSESEYFFVKSQEEDESYWIIDAAEGDRLVHVPGPLAQAFIDDPEFGIPVMEWAIQKIRASQAGSYQTGRNRGFEEGRAQVREALGMGDIARAINRLRDTIEERGA